MLDTIEKIHTLLQRSKNAGTTPAVTFFKTGVGEYAEHDKFIGVSVPVLRRISKEYRELSWDDIHALLYSPYNEERLLALFILIHQYDRANDQSIKDAIYAFYVDHLDQVNNWNLVDASAHLIMGAQLMTKKKDTLLDLARSPSLWRRRVAIVSTWYFIRQGDLKWTFKIAKMLLKDEHDLIHKSVGWMLREAGKRDVDQLIAFLDQHARVMPRTMLRYSLEKFPEKERKAYMSL